ncbi:MarR family winged helix-turn-helix transcriptional regulator [Sedimentitalea todarodis]|uniref:MarR family winged helix-turn-helix transcriptional regulator n=1 Tax=Sedimentitalea todarodis TaxID=1631240 RepID=A0ABU3VIV0_9RHOB|nr:MarR family winged helix-turn-helix transcriptional regulator [Sedimentitalea todarodis]MDU9005624.1 MarR family winged helix-turn-helix transcriptional regulator [Sedimentitalea todarodis]
MDNGDTGLIDERLARLVRLAARAFNRTLQIRLSGHGISFGQWIFLRILWTKEGQSQRELSRMAGVTEPTTHTALQKLETLGLITRRNLPGNQRRQHVFLSEKGRDLRDQLEPLAVEVNDVAVGGLDRTAQDALRDALLTIIDNLKRDEEEAATRGARMPPTRNSSVDI